MATFTVVVPLKGVDKTHNNKGELVGIPFLGPCERMIMDETELRLWLSLFTVGSPEMGSMVYIERHAEVSVPDWTMENNKHDYETPRGYREPTHDLPCAVCGLVYGHWTHRG